jgi:atypical dual specificity phosphatase
MDQVATDLFVGGIEEAGEATALDRHGVTAVVGLTHESPPGGYPDGPSVTTVPMVDGPRNDADAFARGVAAVREALAMGETVVVHCSAGASRSVAVAATALALEREPGLEAAFERVVANRPAADPHPALVRRAANCYVDRR